MHEVHFIAGLSSGETITEGNGNFQIIKGALSPWQRLLRYCEETGAHITSLSLATADGKRWNLPSAGKNPKFKAFADAPKPITYRFFRKMGGDVMTGRVTNEERYAVAEAHYQNGTTLQVWVDKQTQNAWSLFL